MSGRLRIGQILRDGGFVSQCRLELALEEQKHANKLLGQVLVRMGILQSEDVKAALYLQEHLGKREQTIQVAAGVRQMLASLLVYAGNPNELLEQRVTKRTNELVHAVDSANDELRERSSEVEASSIHNAEPLKHVATAARTGQASTNALHEAIREF
jgi:hypothetical protein